MIIAIIVFIFHVLGLMSSIHAVMTARSAQSSIAWGISLNTFPYVTVPAYWIIGRSKFHGYVTARHKGDSAIKQYAVTAEEAVAPFVPKLGREHGDIRAAELLAKIPFMNGNDLKLLVDGDATFESIFEGIDTARDYLLVQFYIVHDDDLGRKLKAKLIAKAKEGVRVYFLYDEVGSYNLPDAYKQELKEAGVEIHDFHSRKGPRNRFQINFRNHRKIVVVDGQTAWIGGHNVGDEYLSKDPKIGHWRDTHVRITGPAVLAVQLSFFEDYYWATDTTIQLDWTPRKIGESDKVVLILPTGPADSLETVSLMFAHAIDSAKKRVWISTPYFIPDESVIKALQLAGLRGVDVRILIPDKSDSLLTELAAYAFVDDASRTGAKIYRYKDGFIHQKVFLVDDNVSSVGTANFDIRSYRLQFEITALIIDTDFASQIEQMLLKDLSQATLMPQNSFQDASSWFRFKVRLAALTAPLL